MSSTFEEPSKDLKLQRRLAADILKVGANRVRLDPNSVKELKTCKHRHQIHKMCTDLVITKRPTVMHSRARVQLRNKAKRKGRHSGMGKRHGTREARLPTKVMWMRRQRVLRRLLKKMRDAKKIDKHIYHSLYMLAKGNQFKNKTVLIETIHDMKSAKTQEKSLEEQAVAKKARAKARLERKAAREVKKLADAVAAAQCEP